MYIIQKTKKNRNFIFLLLYFRISDDKFWQNYFYQIEIIKVRHDIKRENEGINLNIDNHQDIVNEL